MLTPRFALLAGAALFATPAMAQDAQTVTPPPIAATPDTAPATPAPQAQVAPPAQPAPQIQMAPQSPVVQSVPSIEDQQKGTASTAESASAQAAPARARSAATETRSTSTRQTATRQAETRQSAPSTPASDRLAAEDLRSPPPAVAAPSAPPPAQTAVPAAPEAAAPAPADTAAAPATTTTTTETSSTSGTTWPWIAGGILLVLAGIIALVAFGRRRNPQTDTADYPETIVRREPVRTEPVMPVAAAPAAQPLRSDPPVVKAPEPRTRPVYAPAAAAPVAPAMRSPEPKPVVAPVLPVEAVDSREEIEVADAKRSDLEGVADASAPVANRPWLEFGLRPVRAGTSEEEALVDVELTVGNAGDTAARDVRISTFMLADAEPSEMEALMLDHRGDASVDPVTIAPGDGTRLDAHLAVPKGELGRVFNPVVVAEARYTLPDGTEGHTSAAFRIGRPAPDADGVGPIGATRPHMVDSLEAELIGTPEHA